MQQRLLDLDGKGAVSYGPAGRLAHPAKPPSAMSTSTLDAVGNTPIVSLRRVLPAESAEVLIKLEYLNPTGSYKDRMALAMIEEAEARLRVRLLASLISRLRLVSFRMTVGGVGGLSNAPPHFTTGIN
jgi:hypothetical protein